MRIRLLILALLFLLFGVKSVFAEFTFTVPNTTITSDEEIETTITLSLKSQDNKNYYLEGAFKKEESSKYFGLTWNNSSWVKYTSSNFTTLKSITTDTSGKWSGIVKVKIDKDSGLFSGSGTYTLKMKRFTTGGSGSWADNSIDLIVNAPSPTPSSIPIPTSTPTPKPKTISAPSKTAAPTTVPTTPPPTPDTTSTPIPAKSKPKVNYSIASVAAVTASATPAAQVSVKSQKQTNYFVWAGIILVFAGVFSIGYICLRKNANTRIKLGRRD